MKKVAATPRKPRATKAARAPDGALTNNPELAELVGRVDPSEFPIVVLQGCDPATINAAARHWMHSRLPDGARRLTPVDGVPGCKTCAAYTVVDLAAASTPGDRALAMAYVRNVSKLRHAVRTYHSFLVYDMHLVNSRCFLGLNFARVLGTTCRPQALSESLRSHAVVVRVRCAPRAAPPRLRALAAAAIAGDCVASARKYAHEALKTCLDPGLAFAALVESAEVAGTPSTVARRLGSSLTISPSPSGRLALIAAAARLEHLSLQVSRPVHALELMAIVAASPEHAAAFAAGPGRDAA